MHRKATTLSEAFIQLLARPGQLCDVVITWPSGSRRIAQIIKTGACPSHNVPRQVRQPGARVVLADEGGTPQAMFRLQRIEAPRTVIGANGKRYEKGCLLIARRGSARAAGPQDRKVEASPYIGAFAYFSAKEARRVVFDSSRIAGARAQGKSEDGAPGPRYRFLADNVGRKLRKPERDLIGAYGRWIGDLSLFEHHRILGTALITDLFIPSRWALVEAKATVSRGDLRHAIGQLFDYQRYYARHPSLALLTPLKPPLSMLSLLAAKRIAAIWRLPSGGFRDSVGGALTFRLQEAAARRQSRAERQR